MTRRQKTHDTPQGDAPTLAEEVRVSGGIQYCEAIRIALKRLEKALKPLDAFGFLVSAQISYGRILSVGVRQKHASKEGRPHENAIHTADAD